MQMADACAILSVDPCTPLDVAQRSYRKLALLHHPDRSKSANATSHFQRIVAAWQRVQRFHDGPLSAQEQQQRARAAEAARQKKECDEEAARMAIRRARACSALGRVLQSPLELPAPLVSVLDELSSLSDCIDRCERAGLPHSGTEEEREQMRRATRRADLLTDAAADAAAAAEAALNAAAAAAEEEEDETAELLPGRRRDATRRERREAHRGLAGEQRPSAPPTPNPKTAPAHQPGPAAGSAAAQRAKKAETPVMMTRNYLRDRRRARRNMQFD